MVEKKNNNTIVDQKVQAILENSYCSKLRHLFSHFSDILIGSKYYICQFGWLWVSRKLYLLMIREVYNQITSGHLSCQKNISFLACNYYWLKIKNVVHCYIWNCNTCRHIKTPKNWYNDLLKRLLISFYPWTNVILDFVTGLLSSNSYNTVLMVVNQLIKKRHYIPCTTNENSTTVEDTTYLLLNNIWKLYGLLLSLISY